MRIEEYLRDSARRLGSKVALATADRYFSFTLATQPALVTKPPRL